MNVELKDEHDEIIKRLLTSVPASGIVDEIARRESNSEDSPSHPVLMKFPTELLHEALKVIPESIYGPDNRKDMYEVTDQVVLERSSGTVAIFSDTQLVQQPDKTYRIANPITLQAQENLCTGQKFAFQPANANCSGFFVTPDCIITAGHCVPEAPQTVKNLRFVTNYVMTNANTAQQSFDTAQVFVGKEIVRTIFTNRVDYAIIRVTNEVGAHGVPLPVSSTKVGNNDGVSVIGHPSGLPKKYADEAVIHDNSAPSFFVANLDTFGGNSGSPVLNTNNEVVGILVRGNTDYTRTPQGCYIPSIYPTTGTKGEDVQRITGVFGNVSDLTVHIVFGDNGIWGLVQVRKVLIRFKTYGAYKQLPVGTADPHESFEFTFRPSDFGVQTVDDIDRVEIYSPETVSPIFQDSWQLARLRVGINGDQAFFDRSPNHNFPDIPGALERYWFVRLNHC